MPLARAWPVLLACGCFVDPGTASTGPAASTGASTGDAPATTTTGAATTSTTDPTTTAATTTTTAGTTDVDPTTTAADTTTTGVDPTTSDDTTTAPPVSCDRDQIVTLEIADAHLSGGAKVVDIFGFILATGSDADNQVAWSFELPCSAAWFVWVYYYEQDGPDTYTVGFDAGADENFDAGCFDTGQEEMLWSPLNRRAQNKPACDELEDPYTPLLADGVHTLRVGLAKGKHLGPVVLTTDPNYSPK